jgi:cyanophycinase
MNPGKTLDNPQEERMQKANGFFISGGDQPETHFHLWWYLLTILKERYIREKIVLAGTSAGAMALSTPMIIAGSEEVEELTGGVKITTGLEFLKDVCIDTHFVNRARFVRMAQVIVTNPASIGIGIEEDTVIVVRKGSEAEGIGSGLIIIIDGRTWRNPISWNSAVGQKPWRSKISRFIFSDARKNTKSRS